MSYPAISLATATAGRHRRPQKRLQITLQPPVYPNSSSDHRACNSLTPLPLSSRRPSVSIGGFGIRRHVEGVTDAAVTAGKVADRAVGYDDVVDSKTEDRFAERDQHLNGSVDSHQGP